MKKLDRAAEDRRFENNTTLTIRRARFISHRNSTIMMNYFPLEVLFAFAGVVVCCSKRVHTCQKSLSMASIWSIWRFEDVGALHCTALDPEKRWKVSIVMVLWLQCDIFTVWRLERWWKARSVIELWLQCDIFSVWSPDRWQKARSVMTLCLQCDMSRAFRLVRYWKASSVMLLWLQWAICKCCNLVKCRNALLVRVLCWQPEMSNVC